ncbi:hypothetical protein BAE44_0002961 [Dichanthelium oligosanthes]|uniref:Uncharacterized protein n=1 Tax=Dichanthelium oligosanthes TaxID=888268 RepID=A0A1E5WF41_9POAL|nr:hypothetical protein BAE44_0002961 [Dichanthelium oligosanthes]
MAASRCMFLHILNNIGLQHPSRYSVVVRWCFTGAFRMLCIL